MLDKNKINITRDVNNNSIIGTILNKRQNSNDKIATLRPRSSKGNRGNLTNNNQIPLTMQQQ